MSSTRKKNQTIVPTKNDNSELFHIDGMPSNVNFSQSTAILFVCGRDQNDNQGHCDQDDYKGKKSYNETCAASPK